MSMLEIRLQSIIRNNLSKILEFDGFKKFEGVNDSTGFKKMIQNDPAFSPFSLARDKYVVSRIGGNLITSIHRKLGDLYEDLILELLQDRYGFSKDYLKFSLDININGQFQERTTDGRIMLNEINNTELKKRASNLVKGGFAGLAMEVRSCYQIGDSKRIQADDHMATALKELNIEPKLVIMCNSSLVSPVNRLSKNWTVYQGFESFEFIEELTDFDLYSFLMNNQELIEPIMDDIFNLF